MTLAGVSKKLSLLPALTQGEAAFRRKSDVLTKAGSSLMLKEKMTGSISTRSMRARQKSPDSIAPAKSLSEDSTNHKGKVKGQQF